ncbi:hypothetical protein [Archangium primigenium]|uniref:hypothetical protein n=1 Tax=[Archangium] primigenium TaxID=2792470 RepID=UPI001958218F|nr:hypothetical protein [Archangium primigenium]MBM7119158.1 hypothetical protein [Archangium primigenium]
MKWGGVCRASRSWGLVTLLSCPMGGAAVAAPLTFPVLLPEGGGLSVEKASAPSPRGPWWYAWQRGTESVVCPPSTCTPPPGVEAWRVYPQAHPGQWRAGVAVGSPGQPVSVSEVDWSDPLENSTGTTASRMRVEVALYTGLDEPLPTYDLMRLPGSGPRGEAWGVRATNSEPASALGSWSGDATVISPCARLTVQKLVASDAAARPREDAYRWNAVTGEWSGSAATLVNRAVWEDDGRGDGPRAWVDDRGKAVVRLDWEPGRAPLPARVSAAGWYRLTLSLDGSVAGGRRCGPFVLNTSVTEAEVEAGEPYRAVIDAVWNLSYLDVFVRAEAPEPSADVAQMSAGES